MAEQKKTSTHSAVLLAASALTSTVMLTVDWALLPYILKHAWNASLPELIHGIGRMDCRQACCLLVVLRIGARVFSNRS